MFEETPTVKNLRKDEVSKKLNHFSSFMKMEQNGNILNNDILQLPNKNKNILKIQKVSFLHEPCFLALYHDQSLEKTALYIY